VSGVRTKNVSHAPGFSSATATSAGPAQRCGGAVASIRRRGALGARHGALRSAGASVGAPINHPATTTVARNTAVSARSIGSGHGSGSKQLEHRDGVLQEQQRDELRRRGIVGREGAERDRHGGAEDAARQRLHVGHCRAAEVEGQHDLVRRPAPTEGKGLQREPKRGRADLPEEDRQHGGEQEEDERQVHQRPVDPATTARQSAAAADASIR